MFGVVHFRERRLVRESLRAGGTTRQGTWARDESAGVLALRA
jgi:hypothetical protein